MKLARVVTILAMGGGVLLGRAVGAQDVPRELERVVVLPVAGVATTADEVRLESALVATAASLGFASVTGPTELNDRLGEHLAGTTCADARCAARVGSDLGATTVVLARVRPGANKQLDLLLVSAGSGKLKHRTQVGLAKRSELWSHAVGRKLRHAFGASVPAPARAQVAFSRAERAVARDYLVLRRLLTNVRLSHPVKLATVAAFLEAHANSSSAEYEQALAAHHLLADRRDDLRSVSDVECAARADCTERGLCRGTDFGCVAGDVGDCRAAAACERNGQCSYEAGQCVADAMDCAATYACKTRGECTSRAGQCVAANDVDCQSSSRCELTGACYAAAGACVGRSDLATAQR